MKSTKSCSPASSYWGFSFKNWNLCPSSSIEKKIAQRNRGTYLFNVSDTVHSIVFHLNISNIYISMQLFLNELSSKEKGFLIKGPCFLPYFLLILIFHAFESTLNNSEEIQIHTTIIELMWLGLQEAQAQNPRKLKFVM